MQLDGRMRMDVLFVFVHFRRQPQNGKLSIFKSVPFRHLFLKMSVNMWHVFHCSLRSGHTIGGKNRDMKREQAPSCLLYIRHVCSNRWTTRFIGSFLFCGGESLKRHCTWNGIRNLDHFVPASWHKYKPAEFNAKFVFAAELFHKNGKRHTRWTSPAAWPYFIPASCPCERSPSVCRLFIGFV